MNDFKKLLGDTITDETANALQTILETSISQAVEKNKSEIAQLKEEADKKLAEQADKINELQDSARALSEDKQDLVEQLEIAKSDLTRELSEIAEDHEIEIALLKEKAQEFAELVKQETEDSLTENHNESIQTVKTEAEAYGVFLQEKAEAYGVFLKEKAEAYAEQKVQETTELYEEKIQTIQEQAEAYGVFLQEQAEAYAESVKQETISEITQKAEAYGEYLQEQAEAYGAYIIEKAEAYGATLIEQADKYAEEQIQLTEARCLAEAEVALVEFKEQYLEEFERVDEHSRMASVFKNLKQLIESSGFSIEESDQVDELSEEIRTLRSKNRRLERNLRENAEIVKTSKIEKLVESIGEDLTFTDKERIIKSVSLTRCETDEELQNVVKTLVESTYHSAKIETKTVLEESATTKTTTGSGWASRLV